MIIKFATLTTPFILLKALLMAQHFCTIKIRVTNPPGHKDSQGNKYTTVYWYLKNRKVFTSGNTKTVTSGQKIAEVADMGSKTHLHFGVRNASYSNTSNRGGLPTTKCSASGMTSADVWQANFVNPSDYLP